ncbi:MAG: C40 family peptidase, partial [Nocardioidaceae bacterium]|nr:C40 family peptidase [Nocardioidaceae bacterium]
MGFDCSGLALQAMYAEGGDVPDLDANMRVGADSRATPDVHESALAQVPQSERRRGNLLFYGSSITHMAIYLGHDRILEDVGPVAASRRSMPTGCRRILWSSGRSPAGPTDAGANAGSPPQGRRRTQQSYQQQAQRPHRVEVEPRARHGPQAE